MVKKPVDHPDYSRHNTEVIDWLRAISTAGFAHVAPKWAKDDIYETERRCASLYDAVRVLRRLIEEEAHRRGIDT